MTQYQLTLDSKSLQRLFTGDGQVARLLEAVLNQILNAQVTEQLQAAPYERNERLGSDLAARCAAFVRRTSSSSEIA